MQFATKPLDFGSWISEVFFNLCSNAQIDIPGAYFINEKKIEKKRCPTVP
jgi:hypothetical protein